jgi:hypothetical protein
MGREEGWSFSILWWQNLSNTESRENNFGVRKRLLEYDDVMNAQRGVNTNVVVMLYLENVWN